MLVGGGRFAEQVKDRRRVWPATWLAGWRRDVTAPPVDRRAAFGLTSRRKLHGLGVSTHFLSVCLPCLNLTSLCVSAEATVSDRSSSSQVAANKFEVFAIECCMLYNSSLLFDLHIEFNHSLKEATGLLFLKRQKTRFHHHKCHCK